MSEAPLLSLKELLRTYHPSDAQERVYVARMNALLEGGKAVLRRDSFVPGHFTASSFILSRDGRDLLLILHKKLGIWVQPGGHLEPEDRDVLAAARREVAEEVGIRVEEPLRGGIFDVDVHAIPARAHEPAHEHFDVRFAFVADRDDLRASDEVGGAQWIGLADVDAYATDASVKRAACKLLALPRVAGRV